MKQWIASPSVDCAVSPRAARFPNRPARRQAAPSAAGTPARANAATAAFDRLPVGKPLWAAAALSMALHATLLTTLASGLTSAWHGADSAPAPGSGTPLRAVLAPPTAADDAAPEATAAPEPPAPPEPPVEVVPPPALAPVEPATAAPHAASRYAVPAAAESWSPGLTPPGAGPASAPQPPPPPPTDRGDIAVGITTDLSGFEWGTAARLSTQFPVRPGRLPRLARTLPVVYPERALREHAGARVQALLLLDAKGVVQETLLEPDDLVFAPAVREALATASFVPAQAADAPLPYWIALEFVFAIDPAGSGTDKIR